MKFTYFTGLAIIPLVFALTEKEQLNVEDTSLDINLRENAIIFEDGIGELAHSIAKDIDATLAMDAKQRGSDAPISIDSIIELVFADKENIHTTLGDGFRVSKDNLMREVMQEQKYIALDAEKEEIVSDKEQKEATISEEDKRVLSSLHDEIMNGVRNFIMDSIKETKNGIIGVVGQVDISTIFTSFTNMRPVVETAFTSYGSGDSPIERVINILESSVKEFNKKLLAVETDINKDIIQELADGQIETILTSLRTEIRPVVDQHVRFQDPPAEGGDGAKADPVFDVVNVIDTILELVGSLIKYLVDNILGLIFNFFNQNDSQGKFLKNGDMRLHLIKTFEQVADFHLNLIKGHVRASYFMMHILTRAADTFNVFESYLGNLLTSKSMDGTDNGLYALLNDDVQLEKLTNALMRNVKPLSIQIATSLYSFATYNLNTLQETAPGRSFQFNPMNVVFNVLKSWTTDIKVKNEFLGVILEALIGVVETVFKENNSGNFSLIPSLEEIIYTIESIIDTFISTSYLTSLFF
ncbi:hypothetical protein INT45_010507 [Circinella minor]|uniref:Uncharacterized protein n=1 Tax=Circinella minor TaxID=1195481 RepID=A0A8H7S5R6_9FUNG|nr:hypothetical protein INT45_010507 [Circinella minor]